METLDYLRLADAFPQSEKSVKINIITNFTDAILVKLFCGVLASEGVSAEIFSAPYKQYHLLLQNTESVLYGTKADITFIFFDVNPYNRGAFISQDEHWKEVFSDVKEYCSFATGPVVVMNFSIPYTGSYGNLFEFSPLFSLVREANAKLSETSKEIKNLYVCDVNALLHRQGEQNARDFRGLYAFDIPFTHDFLKEIACEWGSYVRAILGKAKKCVVVDLDNTLWGGVVGELGPTGIAVGPDYPGLAFLNFQHALLSLYERGIILAINSKNNAGDVAEVFEKNPHMVLKEKHFASIKANWNDKAKNLMEIAEEINIGLDSIVFLDDDPINRELVRSLVSDVTVPDLPLEPEQYVPMLHSLNLFNQFSLTEEDWQKAKMYADERQRKNVQYSAKNLEDYISALEIRVAPEKNNFSSISRISQMTLKTNQFNLTTKRYGEKEIEDMMKIGFVYAGDVSDKFGEYGKTILAIAKKEGKDTAVLDTFLLSCRVMGRGVEYAFIGYVMEDLQKVGIKNIIASFFPTKKNKPSSEFLSSLGFMETTRKEESVWYEIKLKDLIKNAKEKSGTILFAEII